jgi:peptidoglycan/LPS O-acetylase OafA/YrhL
MDSIAADDPRPLNTPEHRSPVQYRPEIDGLRAVAVLSVFIFHLQRRWLPGGFVGVDVFFVISGFLITTILRRDCDAGRFSYAKFYQRRIARLLPAFATVAFTTLAAAYFIYSPQDRASAGANLIATLLSVANIKFIFQGNYFHLSPDGQPYLHYWSLSVEEQFYLIFPALFLLVILKIKRHTTAALSSLLVVSLLMCIFVTRRNSNYAFFLLPTRAWELLAGAILANISITRGPDPRRIWKVFSFAGLLLIVISVFIIRENSGFPGYIAILPTLGAVLFIGPNGGSDGFTERILSCKPMVIIGRISYSLYLWHWPVFSLLDYQLYQAAPSIRLVLKIGLSLVLTVLCFLFIENPGRRYLNLPQKRWLAFTLLVVALLVGVPLGNWVRKTNYISATMRDVGRGGLVFNADSTTGSIVLMGDSHGSMYGKIAREIADQLGYKLTVTSAVAEDPLPPPAGENRPLWQKSLEIVNREHPDYLILVCRWDEKLDADQSRLATALNALKPSARHIILITEPPQLPEQASRESIRNGSRPPFLEDPTTGEKRLRANQFVESFSAGSVRVINIEHHFERPDGELIIASPSGKMYYHDQTHLSGYGAELVKADLIKLISQFTQPTTEPSR